MKSPEWASYNRDVLHPDRFHAPLPGSAPDYGVPPQQGGIGLIVQARMGSTRLPGKVLRKALGKPMLAYLLESLAKASLGRVILVTSESPADDGIAALGSSMGIDCVRGSEQDVASRFAAAVRRFGFAAFARICGDSPLLDPELIRRGLEEYRIGGHDVVTNTHPRSFPKGQSVEVIRSGTFLKACPAFSEAEDREHVTRYFYRNPAGIRIRNFSCERNLGDCQLSVDTLEDFRRFEALLASADRPHWEYGWSDWMAMNARLAPREGLSS